MRKMNAHAKHPHLRRETAAFKTKNVRIIHICENGYICDYNSAAYAPQKCRILFRFDKLALEISDRQ